MTPKKATHEVREGPFRPHSARNGEWSGAGDAAAVSTDLVEDYVVHGRTNRDRSARRRLGASKQQRDKYGSRLAKPCGVHGRERSPASGVRWHWTLTLTMSVLFQKEKRERERCSPVSMTSDSVS